MNKKKQLVNILYSSARLDEKDDAIMDLADFPDNETLEILYTFSSDIEDQVLFSSLGTVIAEIWKELDIFDQNILEKLPAEVKTEILSAYLNRHSQC